MGIRLSGADESEILTFFRVRYNNQTIARGVTDRDEPRFTVRMVGVGDGCGKRIAEDSGRFLKRHAVFLHVRAFLLLVPLKLHSCNLGHIPRGLIGIGESLSTSPSHTT